MRKALILGLACLALSTGVALAQQGRGQREKQRPPPPVVRCPDLALGAYAYVGAIPGGDPLAADEVALQWNVSNGGNASYTARNSEAQTLQLEYVSAAGVQQLATTPLPPLTSPNGVNLGQGQSWDGYLRVHVPAEARRRPWRLRIRYAGEDRTPPNDCDTANNQVAITRPPG